MGIHILLLKSYTRNVMDKTIEAIRKIYVGPNLQNWESSMIFDYDDLIDLDGARLPLHRMSLFQ